jgi:hypothetical protein
VSSRYGTGDEHSPRMLLVSACCPHGLVFWRPSISGDGEATAAGPRAEEVFPDSKQRCGGTDDVVRRGGVREEGKEGKEPGGRSAIEIGTGWDGAGDGSRRKRSGTSWGAIKATRAGVGTGAETAQGDEMPSSRFPGVVNVWFDSVRFAVGSGQDTFLGSSALPPPGSLIQWRPRVYNYCTS